MNQPHNDMELRNDLCKMIPLPVWKCFISVITCQLIAPEVADVVSTGIIKTLCLCYMKNHISIYRL